MYSTSAYSDNVLIVGGGLGGLALAQGLKRHSIPFHIYEKDTSSSFRAQGYRLRISPDGVAALGQLLPESLFHAFEATCSDVIHGGQRIDAVTAEAADFMNPRVPRGPPGGKTYNADRTVLRNVLLQGMGKDISFGKRFVNYEILEKGDVQVHFDDGSTACGGIMVGADGIWSPVRRQLLPHISVLDTEIRAVFGKTPIREGLLDRVKKEIHKGMCLTIQNEVSCNKLFTDVMAFKHDTAAAFPTINVPEDYIYWVLVFARDLAGQDDRTLLALSDSESAALAEKLTSKWHTSLRAIVTEQDIAATSVLAFQTTTAESLSNAFSQLPAEGMPVTCIGDAAHPQPPLGGVGANSAFQDAAELVTVLAEPTPEQRSKSAKIRQFEQAMSYRVTAAISQSLGGAKGLFGMKPVEEMRPMQRQS